MRWIASLVGLALAGSCLVLGPAGAQGTRVGVAAPEVAGERWVNSEPLTMPGLRGRVVLVEFWTFG